MSIIYTTHVKRMVKNAKKNQRYQLQNFLEVVMFYIIYYLPLVQSVTQKQWLPRVTQTAASGNDKHHWPYMWYIVVINTQTNV